MIVQMADIKWSREFNDRNLPVGLRLPELIYASPFEEYTSVLPNYLIVDGVLDIDHSDCTSLPDGLTVGYLNAFASGLKELPPDLVVHNVADIRLTSVTRIPHTASIGKVYT